MMILLYFSVLLCFAKVNSQSCSYNELADPCRNPCQPTCETPNPPTCNFLWCVPGCVCKPHLILRQEGSDECIPPQQCPPVNAMNCNATNNEKFYECISPCTRTCQSQCRPLELCSAAGCAIRCDCKPGFLRNELTWQCVPERYCPRCSNCPQNEFYSQCDAGCAGTCQNSPDPSCYSNARPCIPGCVCRRGLVRDEISRRCVSEQRCSQIQQG